MQLTWFDLLALFPPPLLVPQSVSAGLSSEQLHQTVHRPVGHQTVLSSEEIRNRNKTLEGHFRLCKALMTVGRPLAAQAQAHSWCAAAGPGGRGMGKGSRGAGWVLRRVIEGAAERGAEADLRGSIKREGDGGVVDRRCTSSCTGRCRRSRRRWC